MRTRVLITGAALAVAALGLLPGTALANRPVFNLSGTVTTVPVGQQITVNGRTYQIAHGSNAERQVQTIVRGEAVTVVLTAPPNTHAAKVVAIHATAGH